MAIVFIPALLRERAGGLRQLEVQGANVNAIVDALDARFPGVRDRLVSGGRLVPGIGVVIDGEVNPDGLRAAVGPTSEVHFLPAVKGGRDGLAHSSAAGKQAERNPPRWNAPGLTR